MNKRKIIFWAVVAAAVIALGLYLKYTSFGVTIATVLVGAVGILVGWIGKILYDRYIKE